MAELNDKLITYDNLSTFYNKLQEQGLGGNTIEEVSELPSASENKDKLFRLDNGEKDVYAAKLLSSETITTNRLPDEQQIDKAYLYDTEDNSINYYKGAYHIICNDGETDGYMWYQEGHVIISLDNAVSISTNGNISGYYEIGEEASIDENTRTITIDDILSMLSDRTLDEETKLIPATYNATESAQIGNAYLYDGDKYYYNGVEYTLNYTDGVSIKAYGWVYDGDEYPTIYTPKKASEIYYTTKGSNKITDAIGYIIDYEKYPVVSGVVTLDYPFSEQSNAMSDFQIMYIPQLNAPDSEQVGKASVYANEEIVTPCFYTGREVTLIATNGTFSCYLWEDTVNDAYVFTKVNAENAYMGAKIKYSSESYFSEIGDDTFETRSNVEEVGFNTYNSRLSTVKYKRSEVTEEWDWEKVATEQYVDDAIDNIDVPEYSAGEGIAIDSANTISCTVKPIADVSTLPDAEANKDSVLRLEGDKKIYLSKYNSNNAPDSEQVGVAYITDDVSEKLYYTGTEVTILASNGTFTGYGWLYEGHSTVLNLENISVEKAEEIFNESALFYNQVDGGVLFHVSGTTYAVKYIGEETLQPITAQTMSNMDILGGYYIKPVGYEWKRVVTEDELDGIGNAIYNLIYTLHPDVDYLNFSANLPNTKVRLVLYSDYEAVPSTPIDIDYSFDRKNWAHYTVGNDITIPTDGKVYLRGNNDYFSVYDYDVKDDVLYYHHFEFVNESENTLNVEAHGNINSLLSKTNWNEITTLADSCYYGMFQGCTSLTTAPELPATTLDSGCYTLMFKDCTSLTSAPSILPATTLAGQCYYYMFSGCTSLATAPELPATTLAINCYYGMFRGCTSLTTAPELPATTLAEKCYANMFRGCSSLTTAPALPATTLASQCYYYMFHSCTSLTTAPALPATTLASQCYYYMFHSCSSLTSAPSILPATTLVDRCYTNMFRNCTSLTNAPELPATTLANQCYDSMFNGCSSLTSAPSILPATTLVDRCYNSMFNGCSSLTTAPELPATTLTSACYQGMFYNCTNLTTAPELPATTLADGCYNNLFYNCTSLTNAPELPATTLVSNCYSGMFRGCSSLTTAPELPATTLASHCYWYMFYDCTNLNYIKCLAVSGINQNNSTTNWVSGVANTGTFVKNPTTTSWTTDVNGIPNGWTVQDAQ